MIILPKPEPQSTKPNTHKPLPAHQTGNPSANLKGKIIAPSADIAIFDAFKRQFI